MFCLKTVLFVINTEFYFLTKNFRNLARGHLDMYTCPMYHDIKILSMPKKAGFIQWRMQYRNKKSSIEPFYSKCYIAIRNLQKKFYSKSFKVLLITMNTFAKIMYAYRDEKTKICSSYYQIKLQIRVLKKMLCFLLPDKLNELCIYILHTVSSEKRCRLMPNRSPSHDIVFCMQ